MLFLIAFVVVAIIALVLWKAMGTVREAPPSGERQAPGPARPRVSGPDDDPDFLRQLDERVRRQQEPPA